MIIMHRSTPSSLLKAAMISRLEGGTCVHAGDMGGSGLFGAHSGDIFDCDGISSELVRQRYEQAYGPVGWLSGPKARQIAGAVFYAARFRSADRYRLVVNVMQQALEKDADYILSRVSTEARSMFNRSRQVSMEAHRACGFIRLFPVDGQYGKIMAGRAEFTHDIADIVLRYFARRHGDSVIYIAAGEQVYYLKGRSVQVTQVENLPFKLPEDDFTGLWEAYYDSQFIEGRKNPALAKKHLPKKYWSWVTEGRKLDE